MNSVILFLKDPKSSTFESEVAKVCRGTPRSIQVLLGCLASKEKALPKVSRKIKEPNPFSRAFCQLGSR